MTESVETPVQPGEVLAGKYRVDRVLGVGGMGIVVAATHQQLHQKVAVKFLLPHMLLNMEATERFLREARAAVQIQSEHVARVIDVGTLETGSPYMVMEFLEGSDLAQCLSNGEQPPIEQAVGYVLQTCEAIAEAHAAGIIHRDLKPANLFRTHRKDGTAQIKVLDFGISKVRTPDDASLTKTSALMGSPLYMSPEQLKSSKDVDPRTDIWSLGVILHELIAGSPPFKRDGMAELVATILMEEPPRLSALRPDVPPGLEAVVLRCLSKTVEFRFQTVADLANALAEFAAPEARVLADRASRILTGAGIAVGQRETTAPTPVAATTNAGTVGAWEETKVPVSRSRAPWFAMGAVVAVAGGGGLFVLTRSAPPAPPSEPSAAALAAPAAAGDTPPVATAEEPPTITPAPPPSASAPPPSVAPAITPPTEAPLRTRRAAEPRREAAPAEKPATKPEPPSEAKPAPPPVPVTAPKPKNPLAIDLK